MRKPLDWFDIAAHSAVAIVVGVFCGFGVHEGISTVIIATGADWLLGLSVIAGSISGLAAMSVYWINRERRQHGFEWGGRQSQWEWIAPIVLMCVSCVASVISLSFIQW